jgi:hypothetical protein
VSQDVDRAVPLSLYSRSCLGEQHAARQQASWLVSRDIDSTGPHLLQSETANMFKASGLLDPWSTVHADGPAEREPSSRRVKDEKKFQHPLLWHGKL